METLIEIFRYRQLLWALVGRQVKARYRGSLLGFFWSFLNPLLLIAVYALIFQFYLRVNIPHYPLFLFCGLLPWLWFSSSLAEGINSIVAGTGFIGKAPFPPQILPASAVLAHLVNFLLSLPILLLVLGITGFSLHLSLLAFPFVVVVQALFTLGLLFPLATLNVYYRDVQHIMGNLLTLWFFLCPIVYPVSAVPESLRFTLYLNPPALLVTMYQDLFFYGGWPRLSDMVVIAAAALLTLGTGSGVFQVYRERLVEMV